MPFFNELQFVFYFMGTLGYYKRSWFTNVTHTWSKFKVIKMTNSDSSDENEMILKNMDI